MRARAGKPSRGREPRPPTELETLCAKLGVKAVATEGAPDVDFEPNDWRATATGWTVKLRYGKTSLTVPFWQGSAHEKPPTAADVISCLLSDTVNVENARDFEEWARDLGFDTDSRKAKKTYNQCERIGRRVRALLGDDFDRLARAEH